MNIISRYLTAIAAATALASNIYGADNRPAVAIVIDKTTYEAVKPAVAEYAASLATDGKRGVVLTDNISHPDSIRMQLLKLYKNDNLEGALLIGDIPVAMVRDAQHFTTAFKMNQKSDWKDSSVPSDRFYDDFDLKFDYIRQDGDVPTLHYYSLRADSPQYICCDIYSSRIKVPVGVAEDVQERYAALAAYLRKAAAARTQRDIMRRVFHFAGHGYNSDSMNARIDESWTLRSQFPFLGTERGCDLDFINFDYNPLVRDRLLKAVATKDLDLAILHHHGSEDTQYLNNTPVSGMLSGKVDEVKSNLRSRMRRSRDVEKTKNEFISDYGIPESWFNGWDDPEVIAKDSADAAAVDLSIPDIKGKETNAKIVIIDACYNGAFNCDDYIAGYYLFNGGSTIAVKANSVNTLQDTWTNELMGLLAEGVCFGNWAKGQLTLESHLFGDAAFRFEARDYAAPGLDVAVNAKKNDSKYWARLLKKGSTDEKSLAIKNLAKLDAISSDELLRIEREDANPVVRLSAFMALQRRADNRLIEAIDLAINDSYELIQRLGMLTAIQNAAPEFGARIKAVKADPLSSPRVSFYGSSHSDNWNDSPAALEEFEKLTDPDYSAKEKRFSIQGLRNSRNPHAIEYILNYIAKGDDQELRIMAAEALGWYVDSYRRDDIVSGLKSLLDEVKDEKISYEIAKSINRLTDYRAK